MTVKELIKALEKMPEDYAKGGSTYQGGGEVKVGDEVGLRFDSQYHKDRTDNFVVEKIENDTYSVRGKKNDNTYSVPRERIIVYRSGSTYQGGGEIKEDDYLWDKNGKKYIVYSIDGDTYRLDTYETKFGAITKTKSEVEKLSKTNPHASKSGSTYQGGGEIEYSNRTSDDFKLGELVYDTRNKRYGTIIGIYDEAEYEVRLDSDGMQPTEYLRKLGEKGDNGTKKQLFEGVASIEGLRKNYPENNYPKLINNPFYVKGGRKK